LRVAPAPGLGVGDLLKIALYVQPSREPLVVDAEIARDDGDAGLGLRFLDLGTEQLKLITRMVSELPGISEPDESAETSGVFVSEVLARETG
ncbi:MAG: PilZ domain-containing protein, partial [Myxococcota bacterium]